MVGVSNTEGALAEYQIIHGFMSQSMTRLWQSAAVTGAAYAAITYVLVNTLPSTLYEDRFKVGAVWIAVGLTVLLNGFMAVVICRETYWQEVAYRRMVRLEATLKFRLVRTGDRLERLSKRRRVRLRRLAGMQVPILLLGTVQVLIIATAALVSIELAS